MTISAPQQQDSMVETKMLETARCFRSVFDAALQAGVRSEDFAGARNRTLWATIADHYDSDPLAEHLDHVLLASRLGPRASLADGISDVAPALGDESQRQLIVALKEESARRTKRDYEVAAAIELKRDEPVRALRLLEEAADVIPLRRTPIQWVGTAEIFAELPPVRWAVEGLQIAPGRPTMFAGYGNDGKSMAMQSLALSLAAGRPIWGHHETDRLRVGHINYEQTPESTYRRYQRLAIGHGIDRPDLGDRLVVVTSPRVFLNSRNAYDHLSRACDGLDLVVIDSLRRATPGSDENSSEMGDHLNMLKDVTLNVGCIFVLIHHVGKSKEGRPLRESLRGNSAIYDNCSCIYIMQPGEEKTDPKRVEQVKVPDHGIGKGVESFQLAIEDTDMNGVRMVWSREQEDGEYSASEVKNHERVIAFLRTQPEPVNQDAVRRGVRMSPNTLKATLDALIGDKVVRAERAKKFNAEMYSLNQHKREAAE
jgi:hypothetical protein